MRSSTFMTEVAEPYAQALLSLAQSSDATDQIADDVNSLLNLINESEDLRSSLISPILEADEKKSLLKRLFEGQIHPYTLNFLLLLADKRRLSFFESIGQEFQKQLRALRNTVVAEVTSAVELTDEQKEAIRQKVLATTQAREVEMVTSVDPDVLGGVIIKVGSQIYDASLRGQLRRIGARLTAAS